MSGRHSGATDVLTVVNGPEDGTEFPLARMPVEIGSGNRCGVCLRLDNTIQEVQARATSAPDGYRIRAVTGRGVRVNGKRVGVVRSRRMRAGDLLQVGYTELVLECAPDGLASRSHGMVLESDLAWAVRQAAGGLARGMGQVASLVWAIASWAGQRWKTAFVVVLVLAYFFVPAFRYRLYDFVGRLVRAVLGTISG